MKAYRLHFKFRLAHSGIPSFIILFIFTMFAIVVTPQEKDILSKLTFETYYGNYKSMYFVIFSLLLIFVNFFILYRNYRRGKLRWLLLPQSKKVILRVDLLWLCSLLVIMLFIQWIVYFIGFHNYLAAIESKEVLNYAQTHNFFLSITKAPILKELFPKSVLHFIGILSAIWLIANVVCFGVAQLLMEKFSKWIVWIGCIFFVALLALVVNQANVIMFLFGLWLYKLTLDCWKNMKVGG